MSFAGFSTEISYNKRMKIICLILALTSFGIMAKDIHPQAIELLGAKKAKKIVVQKKSVNRFIESVLAKRLPKKYKKDVLTCSPCINAGILDFNGSC